MDKDQENQKDNFEQKISDAELEAQQQDAPQEEQIMAPFEELPAESTPVETPPEKKKLSKVRKIWRRILIWLVLIAISFASGFFVDTYLRYSPALDQVASLKTDLNKKTDEVTSLQGEIDRLSQFEEQNTTLGSEIDLLDTHLKLLTARAAVAEASLAVEQDRIADARLSLDKLGTSLESLKGMLNADQAEVVDSMLQRYRLIQIEIDTESSSALTDLDLLANRLITLENNLFANP